MRNVLKYKGVWCSKCVSIDFKRERVDTNMRDK